jgi:predicted SPOUT superfamily RNA methylase MTH1
VGTYWGFSTRLATSINHVFTEGPFHYDYKVGVSERAGLSVDDRKFKLPPFQHLLVVIGGGDGIEDSVENDGELSMSASDASKLFNGYVRTAPTTGSRSVRTEEALAVTLARLAPFIDKANVANAAPSKANGVAFATDKK